MLNVKKKNVKKKIKNLERNDGEAIGEELSKNVKMSNKTFKKRMSEMS